MSLDGLGKSLIQRQTKIQVGGMASGTYKSAGGAERTLSFGKETYHANKLAAWQRTLNNRTVEVTNVTNNHGTTASSGSGFNGESIFGTITAAAGLGFGIAQAAKGFGGSSVAGAGGGASAVSSNSFIAGMQSADTIEDLRRNIANANTRMDMLKDYANPDSEISKTYNANKERKAKLDSDIQTKTDAKTQLEGQVKSKKANIQTQKDKLESFKNQLKSKNDNYKRLCDTEDALKTDISKFTSQLSTVNTSLLEAKAQKAQLAQNGGDTTQLDATIERLTKQKKELETQKTNAEKSLAENQRNQEQALCDIQNLKNDQSKLAQTIENEESKLSQMQDQLKTTESELKKLEEELKPLKDEQKKLADDMDTYEKNQKEYNDIKSAIETQQKRLDKMVKDEEKGAEKLQRKNNASNNYKSFLESDAAVNKDHNNQGAIDKAQNRIKTRQEAIDAAFNRLGLGSMQDNETIKLDGKTYTKHSSGNEVYFTLDDGASRYTIDNMKSRFTTTYRWNYGSDAG